MPRSTYYPEPQISKFLFASKSVAPFWAVLRIYLGWTWFSSGVGKLGNPAWVGSEAGGAVTGFLTRALTLTEGERPSVTLWYGWLIENVFLPNAWLMSHMVAFGETLIGLALILGFLTGIAAFLGGLMNASFLLAGTLSTNPVMFILATWLVLAWRIAGYYGLDYFVLPRIGAPADQRFRETGLLGRLTGKSTREPPADR